MSTDGTEEIKQAPITKPEEAEDIKPDAAGKYPETVPWSQYVRTKETIGHKLDAERTQRLALEEKLKTAVKPEDLAATKKELEDLKATHQKTAEELTNIKNTSITEKRNILKQKGVPEAEVATMSEESLNTAIKVLGYSSPKKPGLDLGSGGGAGTLKGSPMELATQAYASNNKSKK